MTPETVLELARLATTTLLMVMLPAMVVALVVGLIISLLQALTSIQEMTLTFVPKIILVFLAILLALPFMADKMQVMANEIFQRIAAGN